MSEKYVVFACTFILCTILAAFAFFGAIYYRHVEKLNNLDQEVISCELIDTEYNDYIQAVGMSSIYKTEYIAYMKSISYNKLLKIKCTSWEYDQLIQGEYYDVRVWVDNGQIYMSELVL